MKDTLFEQMEWLADFAQFALLLITIPIWIWFYMAFKICKKIWSLK